MQPTDSQSPENGKMPAWLRPSKTAIVVQMILMAATSMAIGIVAFCIIHRWDVEFQRKMEMIRRGEVKPETLSIIRINSEKGNPKGSIAFGKDKTIMVWRSEVPLEGMRIGDETTVYTFGEEYVIPRFDRGNFWGKWIFLVGGLLMAFLVCGGMLLSFLWRPRRDAISHAATESTAVPKAYSRSSMLFDHNPIDSELTCLLKCSCPLAGSKIIETPGIFRVSPARVPIIWIMVHMVLVALVLTFGMYFLIYLPAGQRWLPFDVFFWIWVASWLFIIPVCLAILIFIDRRTTAKDDYFRVDTTKRTLELCREAHTLRAADIVAFTELVRWVHGDDGWGKPWQTGVLVRTANGEVELHPLAEGKSRPRLADRLASIFQVPVRRTKLSWSESRALIDY